MKKTSKKREGGDEGGGREEEIGEGKVQAWLFLFLFVVPMFVTVRSELFFSAGGDV